MTSAAFALQQAIIERLTADADVIAALGGARVYDDVPLRGEFPCLTFGPSTVRDWSTASDSGQEHSVTVNVWSRGHGRKEALAVLAAVEAALDDASLTLDGHRLINLRHESSDVRRDQDGETFLGIGRFRAVTEEM